jgi:hypothetical protein
MTLRKNAPRAKTRWMTLGVAVAACMLLVAGLALATGPVGTASGFEDDDANLVHNALTDWNDFAPVTWLPTTATTPTRTADKVAAGWTFKGIEDWQATTADSGFAGGTKQDADCPSVISAKAPNKDDLKRIYLATKTGANGHTYLNLGWVRIPQNTTSPSAHIGFEFNKGNNGACPASADGLVKRSAGDLLIVYDFEGGGTPVLTLRKWVLSGACDVSSDTAPCWGVATNLTATGFAEGAVNTGSTALDLLTPPALGTAGTSVSSTLGISEFGEAGVDLTGAGVFTAGTCESFGKAYGVSRSSGNSGTAQMKDLVGPANFTLSNCGTITIIKHTNPRGLNQSFGYSTTGGLVPSTFTLNDNGNTTGDSAGNTRIYTNVLAGSYSVTENADPTGFAFASLTCTPAGTGTSVSTSGRTATITMAGGGSVTCTYVNDQQRGALKILKNSSKGGAVATAGAVFSYDSSSVTDNGTGDEDSTVGVVCVSGLAPGDYTVNETSPPSGYAGAPLSEANQTVTVASGTNCTSNLPGASATATFTNPPLSDIQVNFRDGGSGETSATITCDNTTGTGSNTAATGWDTSRTVTDVSAPTTINCTIVIDP